MSNKILNLFSRTITQPKHRGAAQAMLYALGLSPSDLEKPQIGICSMWYDGNPCNSKLNILQNKVKKSVSDVDYIPMRFNTVGVSDGMSMGTKGMRYSLPSRELIADSIETIVSAQHYDGLVCIPGCDKNLPGSLMGMMRLNRPSCLVYGGSMRPQTLKGSKLDIVSAFETFGQYLSGDINDGQRQKIIQHACDSKKCGSCSGFYTANTMACLIEVMGLSLPNSSSNMSLSEEKLQECGQIGEVLQNLIEKDQKPRDIVTKESFMNAVKMLYVVGGSTNAIIHLLAVAREASIDFTLDDCQKLESTAVLLNMKPHGKYCMWDLYNAGGTGALCKYLIEKNILNGDTMTITGRTLWENVKEISTEKIEQRDLLFPCTKPFKQDSHIKILKGVLAPSGCVSKIYSEEGEFSGEAIVFDSEEEMLSALKEGKITKKHFIILRYQGESIGCPEMLAPTSALVGYFGRDTPPPFATDGRFSGGSKGILVAHLPDAYNIYSPTARIKNGDKISISTKTNSIDIDVPYMEFRNRELKPMPQMKIGNGYLNKFNRLVGTIETGYSTG